MAEGNVYVQVLYDFYYITEDGNEIFMKEGEELLVVKKSNNDWWQVMRNSGNYPFYAPSSYLNVISNLCNDAFNENCNVSDENANINNTRKSYDFHKENSLSQLDGLALHVNEEIAVTKMTTEQMLCPLSFSNPLCITNYSESKCYQNEITQKGSMSLGTEPEIDASESSRSTVPKIDHGSLNHDSMLPIYANIPLSTSKPPPVPTPDDKPHRSLSNSWFEYVDITGRKYYYHSISGKVTWKPPRHRECHQSIPVCSSQGSPELYNSQMRVPEPPPKQLKPELKKLAHSSTESLDSPTSCMFIILPSGWTQECDIESGSVYYYNDASNKKWYSSEDKNGRPYFFEENSADSFWELPDLSVSSDSEDLKLCESIGSSETSADHSIPTISSLVESENIVPALVSPKLRNKKIPRLPDPRQFRAKSMVVPESINVSHVDNGKSFLPCSFETVIREGTLNKTKLVEGGRRLRKNWSTSLVILTNEFLLFYKDSRTAHFEIPSGKPELSIYLNGSLLEWCPEKSSRKNVFQISTIFGHQLLLQDDNAETTKQWFDAIQNTIMLLPSNLEHIPAKFVEKIDYLKKDAKLARSKSTKEYCGDKKSSEDVAIPAEKKLKIRDKLRQFFVKRPTMESLREKGIIRDEPVFGCLLENLCDRENQTVPKFLVTCISTIEKKELTADGLYRASGNLSQVQKIRFHVNQDDYSCLDEEDDVHVLTGALKLFFREMKEPLFPFETFQHFMSAIALPDTKNKLRVLEDLVHKLPVPNYETLKFLLQHLLKVTEYHKQNRMQVQNIAIVFGPTLMWPEAESANIALDMMHQNRIVEFLLLEFNAIFH